MPDKRQIGLMAIEEETVLFNLTLDVNSGLASSQQEVLAYVSACAIADVRRSAGHETTWLEVLNRARESRGKEALPDLEQGANEALARRYGTRFQLKGRCDDSSGIGILSVIIRGNFEVTPL